MGKYKGSQCHFFVLGIWITQWLANDPALRDPLQSDIDNIFFVLFKWIVSKYILLIFFPFISIIFSLLPSFLKVEKAVFLYMSSCGNHGYSFPLFKLNIHICHLVVCLFFYEIVIGSQCNICVHPENFWNNSNLFVLKNMSFLYAPFASTHSQNNFCNSSLLNLSLYLHFSLNLSLWLQIPHSLMRSLECQRF